jgi:ankyrin repeat protein
VAAVLALARHGADANSHGAKGYTALAVAAGAGNIEVLKALISSGASPTATDATGMATPLHHAAESNAAECAAALLAAGADANAVDKRGASALHIAAARGSCEAIKALLAAEGIDAVRRDANGQTPYDVAVAKGQTKAAALLPHPNALIEAVKAGDPKRVQVLLRRGDDPAATDPNGLTPLHHAAGHGFLQCAELLVDAGASHGARDAQGRAPLHLAARRVKPDLVQFLLDRGADPKIGDNRGRLAIHSSAAKNALSSFKLLHAVTPVDAVDNDGITPSMCAAASNAAETLRFIVGHGSSWRAADKRGRIAYDHALAAGAKACVAELSGAPVLCMLVSDKDSDNLVRLLRDGADPNARLPQSGKTPMHVACELDAAAQLRVLLDTLGDATLTDATGGTPLHTAGEFGSIQAIEMLLAEGGGVSALEAYVCRTGDSREAISFFFFFPSFFFFFKFFLYIYFSFHQNSI